ncbi:hypothetical protein DFA_07370 [Cavenderia fasciculata]|uniref:Uncharacterized protein n=1 Tax=Cavenderia fasciculata TaxID=261658 RepID=F4PW83_CACFS|nr:uncharacterized protein DFA_07370 [Cavenderia fasciculata]EGG20247.1 hypothetical protein DFA_07370 [Cavenderia fasciculata]|eukprot:XP_004367230.1 hypothetical protein DFA_07370 [Cavenderia fasciculata]
MTNPHGLEDTGERERWILERGYNEEEEEEDYMMIVGIWGSGTNTLYATRFVMVITNPHPAAPYSCASKSRHRYSPNHHS